MFAECVLFGYLYLDGNTLAVTREDGCSVEVIERTVEQFVLADAGSWVLVNVPQKFRRAGQVSWWYRFGSQNIYVQGLAFPVEQGRTLPQPKGVRP